MSKPEYQRSGQGEQFHHAAHGSLLKNRISAHEELVRQRPELILRQTDALDYVGGVAVAAVNIGLMCCKMRAYEADTRISDPERHCQPTLVGKETAKARFLMTCHHIMNGPADSFLCVAQDLAVAHLMLANLYQARQVLIHRCTPILCTAVYPWSRVIVALLHADQVNVVAGL